MNKCAIAFGRLLLAIGMSQNQKFLSAQKLYQPYELVGKFEEVVCV
jgi:hypothetical protein